MSNPIAQKTPPPWDYIDGKTLWHVETRHDNPIGAGIPICSVPKSQEHKAEMIVHFANDHAELVSALESLCSGPYPDDMRLLIAGIGGRKQVVDSAMEVCAEWESKLTKARAVLAMAKGQA